MTVFLCDCGLFVRRTYFHLHECNYGSAQWYVVVWHDMLVYVIYMVYANRCALQIWHACMTMSFVHFYLPNWR